MDAFYASVEQLLRPSFSGKPLVVAGKGTHAVVSAASYEARSYGIRSAMPLSRALKLCPDLIVAPVRFHAYKAYSIRISEVLSRYTPTIEPMALDEAYLDVTESTLRFGPPSSIASSIKQSIYEEMGLNCSIGVGPSKFIAKLCSKIAKPNGIFVLNENDVAAFIATLPVESIWGVGPMTAKTLKSIGCHNIADIRNCQQKRLNRYLGQATADRISQLAWGIDDSPVVANSKRKSIGHEITFDKDLFQIKEAETWLENIAAELGTTLRAAGLACGAITLKTKYADQCIMTRQKSVPHGNSDRMIANEARELANRHLEPERGIRLLGLTATKLSAGQQTTLFDNANTNTNLYESIDKIRQRYGTKSLIAGAALKDSSRKT